MLGRKTSTPTDAAVALPVWLKRGRCVEVRTAEGLWESGTVQSIRERDGETWIKLRLFGKEASYPLRNVHLRCGSQEFPTAIADERKKTETLGCKNGTVSVTNGHAPECTGSVSSSPQQPTRPCFAAELLSQRRSPGPNAESVPVLAPNTQSLDEVLLQRSDWQEAAKKLVELFALNDFTLYASLLKIDLTTDAVCFQVSPCLDRVDLPELIVHECRAQRSQRLNAISLPSAGVTVQQPALPEAVFAELLSTVTFLCDGEHPETKHLLACLQRRGELLPTLQAYICERLHDLVGATREAARAPQEERMTSPEKSSRLVTDASSGAAEHPKVPQTLGDPSFIALNLFITASNLLDTAIRDLAKEQRALPPATSGQERNASLARGVLEALLPSPAFMQKHLVTALDWVDLLQQESSTSPKSVMGERLAEELDEHLRLLLGGWMLMTDSDLAALSVVVSDLRIAQHFFRLYSVERLLDSLSRSDQERLRGETDEVDPALWAMVRIWPDLVAAQELCWLPNSGYTLLLHCQKICKEAWGTSSARQLERYGASTLRHQLLETFTRLCCADSKLLLRALSEASAVSTWADLLRRLWELLTEGLREDDIEDSSSDETLTEDALAQQTMRVVRDAFFPAVMRFLASCHIACLRESSELFLQRVCNALGFSSRRGLDRLLAVLRRLPLVAGRLTNTDDRAAYMVLLHGLENRRREASVAAGLHPLHTSVEAVDVSQERPSTAPDAAEPSTCLRLPDWDWSRLSAGDFGERSWYTLLSYRLAILEDRKQRMLDTDDGKPSPFIHLTANEYLVPPSVAPAHADVCQCIGACVPGVCLNSTVCVECNPATCPVARSRSSTDPQCGNMRFQRQAYAPVELFFSPNGRGCGIRSRAPLKKGDFIVEYMGEVIGPTELARRKRDHALERHVYFMTLDQSTFLDASRKGTWGRFLNHSCEPNCHTQKWLVLGKVRVGIFASRDIAAGEELTFDYRMERRAAAAAAAEETSLLQRVSPRRDLDLNESDASVPIRCLCQAASCSGWISGGPFASALDEQQAMEAVEHRRAASLQHITEQIAGIRKALGPRRRSVSAEEDTGAAVDAAAKLLLTAWDDGDDDMNRETPAAGGQQVPASASVTSAMLVDVSAVPYIPRRKRAFPQDDTTDAKRTQRSEGNVASSSSSEERPATQQHAALPNRNGADKHSGRESATEQAAAPEDTSIIEKSAPEGVVAGVSHRSARITCFACGKIGHKRRDCPASKAGIPRLPSIGRIASNGITEQKQAAGQMFQGRNMCSTIHPKDAAGRPVQHDPSAQWARSAVHASSVPLETSLQTLQQQGSAYGMFRFETSTYRGVLDGYASDASCGQEHR